MRRFLVPLVAAMLLVPGVTAAQSAALDEAGARAIGQQWVQWFFDFQVDSLYEAMTPEFRDQIGGKPSIEGAINETISERGLESEVVKEEVTRSESGTFTYTRVSKFEDPGALMQWTFVITPERRMAMGGMREYLGE